MWLIITPMVGVSRILLRRPTETAHEYTDTDQYDDEQHATTNTTTAVVTMFQITTTVVCVTARFLDSVLQPA